MTDNVIRYDPDTGRETWPNGVCYRDAVATAKALHEAEQKIAQLEAARGKRPWCGSYAHLADPPDDLPPGVAPHPSLPEGEYLAIDATLAAHEWEVVKTDDWPKIVRRIPAPATKRVPLHKVIGERLPSDAISLVARYASTSDGVDLYLSPLPPNESVAYWTGPVTVDDDGTVEVLA